MNAYVDKTARMYTQIVFALQKQALMDWFFTQVDFLFTKAGSHGLILYLSRLSLYKSRLSWPDSIPKVNFSFRKQDLMARFYTKVDFLFTKAGSLGLILY